MIRLLHVDTFQFQEFQDQPPPYAITSHRWQDGEVTLSDVTHETNLDKPGFVKIQGFCAALRRMFELSPDAHSRIEWIWIDTCCIDKANFTELSEAINSMFRWYADSAICLARLHDVGPLSLLPRDFHQQFLDSEWWKRGWCLQELLAPKTVVLINESWEVIGHKSSLEQPLPFSTSAIGHSLNLEIEARTGIVRDVLADFTKGATLSAATKKSWMEDRITTRPEDRAYCQLGIFNIFMPLIYGEREHAMTRLEENLKAVYGGTLEESDAKSSGLSNGGSSPLRGNTASKDPDDLSSRSAHQSHESPKSLSKELYRAARAGNASKVAKLLGEGAENTWNSFNNL